MSHPEAGLGAISGTKFRNEKPEPGISQLILLCVIHLVGIKFQSEASFGSGYLCYYSPNPSLTLHLHKILNLASL
jgi:hypothetical protein